MNSAIIGAGLYGEVYYSYLKHDGKVKIVGFLDDDETKTMVQGVPVIGKIKEFDKLIPYKVKDIYCPLGENVIRCEALSTARQLNFDTPNYFHSSSIISCDSQIGIGVYVLVGSIIMPFVTIKDFCMIGMDATIAHHTVLENGVFISTGVNIGASVHIQENVFIGIGATIMTGVKSIGKNAIIGAGSVVIRDVPDNAVVAGVPAKILKYNL